MFVHAEGYGVDVGAHVLQWRKYAAVREALLAAGVPTDDFVAPASIGWDDLALVHADAYLDDLRHARATPDTLWSQLPVTPAVIESQRLAAGGMLLAARHALERGWAVNLGGGFHHAMPGHAEGFCFVNDLAATVRVLRREGRIERAVIVDLDVHQGNGTAVILAGDASAFTMSMHQRDLYPPKERSDLDLAFDSGCGDAPYLAALAAALPGVLNGQAPDLALYQAGVDGYAGDQLGGLRLSEAALRERDALVVAACRERGIPLAASIGGGYALDPRDTLRLHVTTCMIVSGR